MGKTAPPSRQRCGTGRGTGEFGSGKLAEESSQAAANIAKLAGEIRQETQNIVKDIDLSNDISRQQSSTVEEAEELFHKIENGGDNIDRAIHEVATAIKAMNDSGKNVAEQVENISAGAQDSAASTEELSSMVEQQNQAV